MHTSITCMVISDAGLDDRGKGGFSYILSGRSIISLMRGARDADIAFGECQVCGELAPVSQMGIFINCPICQPYSFLRMLESRKPLPEEPKI